MAAVLFVVTIPKVYRDEAKCKFSSPDNKTAVSFDVENEVSLMDQSGITSPMSNEFYNIKRKFADSTTNNFCNKFMGDVSDGGARNKDAMVSNGATNGRSKIGRSLSFDNVRDLPKDEENGKAHNLEKSCDSNTDSLDDIPVEKVLEDVLLRLGVSDAVWSGLEPSGTSQRVQVSFGMRGGARCESALRALRAAGLGLRSGTAVSVLPCALHYSPPPVTKGNKDDSIKEQGPKDSAWTTFVQSVRARLTVAQVSEQVRAGAALTFDFCFLLIVAALTAAIGLAEDSTVFLVASMLISPLMGPIMAGTFGTAVRDRDLQRMGVLNELFGLFLALVVGFVFGLVICSIDESYGIGEWPTLEITSRCELRSLWVGALIAVPSGAAVAIAILADNTASLVGVAISASLLPPAVNAGLLWAMSLVHLIFLNDETKFTTVVKTQIYSDNPVIELAVNGGISLCLTLVNIICIFFAGILVYMIKEVAPVNSKDEQFWKYDIKMARNFNKSKKHSMTEKTLPRDINNGNQNNLLYNDGIDQDGAWNGDTLGYSHSSRELVERLRLASGSHMTWSPSGNFGRRPTAHELNGMYRRLSEDPVPIKRMSYPHGRFLDYSRMTDDSPSINHNYLTEGTVHTQSPENSQVKGLSGLANAVIGNNVTPGGTKFTIIKVREDNNVQVATKRSDLNNYKY